VASLVFEAPEAAFPHIGETVAAAVLGRALLEAEGFTGRIGKRGRGVVEDAA
jgi:hypothetical protein